MINALMRRSGVFSLRGVKSTTKRCISEYWQQFAATAANGGEVTMAIVTASGGLAAAVGCLSKTDFFRVRSVHKLIKQPIKDPVRLVPPDSYVPIPGLVKPLENAMTAQECGIHVLCLPFDGGKTTTACRVANDLVAKNKASGALYIDLAGSAEVESRGKFHDLVMTLRSILPEHATVDEPASHRLLHHLCQKLDVKVFSPSFPRVPTSDVGGPRTVVILDNADPFFEGNDESKACVRHLAGESIRTKNFSIVVLCRSPQIAEQIWSYNGKKKIHIVHPDGLMDEPTAQTIIDKYATKYPFENDAVKQEFVKKAGEAGAPGFIVNNANWVRKVPTVEKELTDRLEQALNVQKAQQEQLKQYRQAWLQYRFYVTPEM